MGAIKEVSKQGGIMGLRPGPDSYLPAGGCGQFCNHKLTGCAGSMYDFANAFSHSALRAYIGGLYGQYLHNGQYPGSVTFGSDFVGNIAMVGPRFGPLACREAAVPPSFTMKVFIYL